MVVKIREFCDKNYDFYFVQGALYLYHVGNVRFAEIVSPIHSVDVWVLIINRDWFRKAVFSVSSAMTI